jgi:hypothetical protein
MTVVTSVIPAQPGFTALHYWGGADDGAVEKLPVIGWFVSHRYKGPVFPVMVSGVQEKGPFFAVMQPDGQVVCGDDDIWDSYEDWLRAMNRRFDEARTSKLETGT